MPRQAYLIEIQPGDVAGIAFAAGVLTAQGVPQGQLLGNLLDNIQIVEIPDDFNSEGGQEEDYENEGGAVLDFPTQQPLDYEEDTTEYPPEPDLEALGIPRNLPAPPANYFPQNNPADFGAGPPPKGD